MKKRITLQRVQNHGDVQRALSEIERVLNLIKLDETGAIVVGGSGGDFVGGVGGGGGTGGNGGSGSGSQGPQGPPGAQGVPGVPGAAGSTLPPETIGFNVPVAIPGVWSVGETTVYKKSVLFKISADQSCLVRIYFNAALRDADVAAMRPPTTDPGPAVILAEVGLALANDRMQFLSPVPIVYNADDPFTDTIYWAVQQTMLTDVAVNVELYILPLEV